LIGSFEEPMEYIKFHYKGSFGFGFDDLKSFINSETKKSPAP